MTNRNFLLAGISALSLVAGAPALAESVPVQVSAASDKAQLTFSMARPVEHTATLEGNRLFLNFNRAVTTNTTTLARRLGDWAERAYATPNGRQIVIVLRQQAVVSSRRAGNQVIVTLHPLTTEAKLERDNPPAAGKEKAEPVAAETPRRPASVRIGEHPGYGRLVFVVGASAKYTSARKGDILEVRIRTALTPAPERLQRLRLPQLKSVTARREGRELVLAIQLKPGARVRDFRAEDGVGFDLLDAPVLATRSPTVTAEAKPKAAPPIKPVEQKEVAAPSAPSVSPPLPTEQVAANASSEELAPFPADTVTPTETPTAAVAAATAPTPVVETAGLLPSAEITLPAGQGVSILERFGTLFVVVPGREPNDLASLVGNQLMLTGRARLLNTEGPGRAAAINLPAGAHPHIEAIPNGWRVTFEATPATLRQAIPVDRQPDFALGSRLLVRAEGAGQPVTFRDPNVGDLLTLVPVSRVGNGVGQRLRLPQAEVLPTLQGVAVRPWSDDLSIVSTSNGVELMAAGGLQMAENLGEARAIVSAAPMRLNLPPLFDFDTWGRYAKGNFTRERQRLQAEVAATPEKSRNLPRVDLARFYFMRGMPVEAAGMWQLIGLSSPELADRPEFHLTNAIARFSLGDEAGARAALAKVNQPTTDAALWNGYLEALARNWPAAAEQFRAGLSRLPEYPDPYYSRLALMAIEAFKMAGDEGVARDILAGLTARQEKSVAGLQPGTLYFSGSLAPNDEAARSSFNAAAKAWQQYWRVRADIALTEADFAEGKLALREVVNRYERLRFAWRGDALEFDILYRLAHLHLKNLQYAEAFEDYGQLQARFPADPRTASLLDEQKAAFRELYLGPPATQVPERVQLAVWNRYPELRPENVDERVAIMRELAERAVRIDLLEQASTLLTDVLAAVKEPVERARLGARIAGLKLLDGHEEAALALLNETELALPDEDSQTLSLPKLPADLATERRYLRAQTLSGLGQVEAALSLLSGDETELARRLKVDITWRAKRWSEAADALASFIGAPDKEGNLSDADRTLVVRRATALALAGDTAGLAAMRMQYAMAMDRTVDGPTFQLLTRPDGESALADAATLGKRVAEVQLFSDFLSRYRASDTAAEAPPLAATP